MINGLTFFFYFEVVVIEESDSFILGILNDAVPEAERNFANDMITVDVSTVTVNRESVDASFKIGMLYMYIQHRKYYTLSDL